MPVLENPQWRDLHNMIHLRIHQLASADFEWSGRNSYAFNRCFLVRDGEGCVRNHTGNEFFHLRRGTALFMPESADLSFEFHRGLKFLSCHFNLYILPGVDLFQKERFCREFPVDPMECREMEKKILDFPDWPAVCAFESFFWRMIRHIPLPDPNPFGDLARLTGRYGGLLRHIQDHLSAQLDVAELAECAGVARDTLSRNFSRDFAMPLKQFLQKELISLASRLLLCSGLSIREIADRLRFSSEYYFSSFFKRHTGTTPSAFRRLNCHRSILFRGRRERRECGEDGG